MQIRMIIFGQRDRIQRDEFIFIMLLQHEKYINEKRQNPKMKVHKLELRKTLKCKSKNSDRPHINPLGNQPTQHFTSAVQDYKPNFSNYLHQHPNTYSNITKNSFIALSQTNNLPHQNCSNLPTGIKPKKSNNISPFQFKSTQNDGLKKQLEKNQKNKCQNKKSTIKKHNKLKLQINQENIKNKSNKRIAQKVLNIILKNKNIQKYISIDKLTQLVKKIVKQEINKTAVEPSYLPQKPKGQRKYIHQKHHSLIDKQIQQSQITISKLTTLKSMNNTTYDLLSLKQQQMPCFNKSISSVCQQIQIQTKRQKNQYCLSEIHTLQTLCISQQAQNLYKLTESQEQNIENTIKIISEYTFHNKTMFMKSDQYLLSQSKESKQKSNIFTKKNKANNQEYIHKQPILNKYQQHLQISQQNENSIQSYQSNDINSLQTIIRSLKQRQQRLIDQRNRQMNQLELKLQKSLITKEQFLSQTKNILIWINEQIKQINEVLQQLQNGKQKLNLINSLQEKTSNQIHVRKKQGKSNSQKLFKIKLPPSIVQEKQLLMNSKKPNQNISNPQKKQFQQQSVQFQTFKEALHNNKANLFSSINYANEENIHNNSLQNSPNQQQSQLNLNLSEQKIERFQSSPQQQKINDNINKVSEFIFIDLCIEIYFDKLSNREFIKNFKRKFLSKQKIKRKGISFEIPMINDFLNQFSLFYSQKNEQEYLKNLNHPLGPSGQQMLKFVREYEQEMQQSESNNSSSFIGSVLDNEFFQKFDKGYVEKLLIQPYYNDQNYQKKRSIFLRQCCGIFHKSIFDALNEHLDQQRVYGQWGKPFPWKKSTNLKSSYNVQQRQIIFNQCILQVKKDCSYFCGIIFDKEFGMFQNNNIPKNYQDQMRQDRLSKMLANQLMDNQYKWVFYDDDETQLLVKLANIIQKVLLKQMINDIKIFTL